MTMEGFTSFLMSSDNSGFSERQLRVCDDMTRPLCEYYISSSHNVSQAATGNCFSMMVMMR
jgi:phosphatidylinositol phospholipase C delta